MMRQSFIFGTPLLLMCRSTHCDGSPSVKSTEFSVWNQYRLFQSPQLNANDHSLTVQLPLG
jgi:hypothetical protein